MKCIQIFPHATWKHNQFALALLYSKTNFNDKNCGRSRHSKPLKFYNHGSGEDILINPFSMAMCVGSGFFGKHMLPLARETFQKAVRYACLHQLSSPGKRRPA